MGVLDVASDISAVLNATTSYLHLLPDSLIRGRVWYVDKTQVYRIRQP